MQKHLRMSNFFTTFAAVNELNRLLKYETPMKKGTKIALWVVGSVVGIVIIALITINLWASSVVQKELNKSLAEVPEIDASIGRVNVLLLSGSVIVSDIHFATCAFAHKSDTDEIALQPGLRVDIDKVALGPVDYYSLFKHKELQIFNVSVLDPKVTLYIDEKHPEKCFPELPKDTTIKDPQQFIKNAALSHFHMNNLDVHVKSLTSPLDLEVENLDLGVNGLAYSLTDSTFQYNDSVYSLSLGSLVAKLPDGISAAEVHELETEDQGPLKLGYTRFYNTISSLKLADRVKEPSTWIDVELKSLETSPINPIRKALNADYTLESLTTEVKRLQVKRDERYEPKKPFPTPQQFLRKLPVVFDVKSVKAKVDKLDIELYLQRENCGEMHLQDLTANLKNVTNRKGATWSNSAHAPVGDKGVMDASFDMHMDKNSTFDVHLNGKDIEGSFLTPFLRPLVGMSLDCNIHELDAKYSGDDKIASGEFCMLYDGLRIQAYKEDKVPFSVVTKHADAITNVANSLLTKSNPTAVDISPRRYSVEWKRDEWKEYPLFIFGPCIMGTVQTLLPGLYVHKQIRDK